jgi:hypothetical protein
LATNSPPLLHQPPRTPKNTQEEGQEKMHTMSKLLEKDKAVMN